VTVKHGQKASAPSSGASPSEFAKTQKAHPTIFWGRPYDQNGPPIVLFHNVFGQFLANYANAALPLPNDLYKKTQDLLARAANFYPNEESRNNAMAEALGEIFGEPMLPISYSQRKSCDGAWITMNQNQIAYRVIFEGKKEICQNQAEPTLQGCMYYHGYWSQNNVC
jgi:hypothetical protein